MSTNVIPFPRQPEEKTVFIGFGYGCHLVVTFDASFCRVFRYAHLSEAQAEAERLVRDEGFEWDHPLGDGGAA